MLSIDQVKLLENKVARAIDLIKTLSDEKDVLQKEIEARDARIEELEKILLSFKADQSQIEEKVINALNQLSAFEDAVYEKKEDSAVNNTYQAPSNSGDSGKQDFASAESVSLKEKKPEVNTPSSSIKSNLQKDLADVLGTSKNEDKEDESEADADKQLDIF